MYLYKSAYVYICETLGVYECMYVSLLCASRVWSVTVHVYTVVYYDVDSIAVCLCDTGGPAAVVNATTGTTGTASATTTVAEDSCSNRDKLATFEMKGYAALDDVCAALDIDFEQAIEAAGFGESSTIGGLLCALAERIPRAGDGIEFAGYLFTVQAVEEDRVILSITAEQLPQPSLLRSREDTEGKEGIEG